MYRNAWHKMTHDTLYSVCRYTPDAKETKDMINAKGVKIITHLFKALFPPRKSILLHPLPVVSWKSPVLPDRCEVIWRSTCLGLHIVKFGRYPRIGTVTIDADG